MEINTDQLNNDLLPWEHNNWLDQATQWIHSHLARNGLEATGPVEILHQRAWSAFAGVPTTAGAVYFKAPAPAYAYEAPLTEALARWQPERTVQVLSVDIDRGWILSADSGDTLRSIASSPAQVDHWVKIVSENANLQREMVSCVPELLGFQVPDRRLVALPGLYNQLLEEEENLLIGRESGLTLQEHRQLLELRPKFAEWCAQLASFGLPETLTHEEVHDANVIVHGNRYIFTDWSDCSISHPFFTMLVTIRAAAHRLKLGEFGPEMMRIRDAYLNTWTEFAPREDLLSAYNIAYRLGMVNRALSWNHGTGSLAWRHKEPYADAVPGWLQDFLIATKR